MSYNIDCRVVALFHTVSKKWFAVLMIGKKTNFTDALSCSHNFQLPFQQRVFL